MSELPEDRVFARRDRVRGAVLIVGAGAVGGFVAEELARIGISPLWLVDRDVLEVENLIRHPLGAQSLGQPKASALAAKISRDFPLCEAIGLDDDFLELPEEERIHLVRLADVVVAATDNFACQQQVNRACLAAETPAVFPAVWVDPRIRAAEVLEIQWVLPGLHTPCYECAFAFRQSEADAQAARGARVDIQLLALTSAQVVMGLLNPNSDRAAMLDPERTCIYIHGFTPTSRGIRRTFPTPGLRNSYIRIDFPGQPCPACGGVDVRLTPRRNRSSTPGPNARLRAAPQRDRTAPPRALTRPPDPGRIPHTPPPPAREAHHQPTEPAHEARPLPPTGATPGPPPAITHAVFPRTTPAAGQPGALHPQAPAPRQPQVFDDVVGTPPGGTDQTPELSRWLWAGLAALFVVLLGWGVWTVMGATTRAITGGNQTSVPTKRSSTQPTSPAHSSVRTASVKVPADSQGGVNTGIYALKGDKIVITSRGSAGYGYEGTQGCVGSPTTHPGGSRYRGSFNCGPKDDPNAALSGAAIGLLIAKIGGGAWFGVGTGTTFTAGGSGYIYLAYNDSVYSDNTGSYSASITSSSTH